METVESNFSPRETEMMICLKEQGYYGVLDGIIHFRIDDLMVIYKIIIAEQTSDALRGVPAQ